MVSRNKTFVAFLFLTLSFSLLGTSSIVSSKPNILHVYAGSEIQPAIDSANPGDTVIVHEGTYNGGLNITKPLTLKGEGAIIDYPAQSNSSLDAFSAIWVQEGGVRVTGFTIHTYGYNRGIMNVKPDSFTVGPALIDSVVIDNNVIEAQNGPGISAWNATNVEISKNVVTSISPVWATGAPSLLVRNNVLNSVMSSNPSSQTPTGIRAADAPNIVIRDNVISAMADPNFVTPMPTGNPYGILPSSSGIILEKLSSDPFSGGIIENNQITSDCYGIRIGSLPLAPVYTGPEISNVKIRNNIVHSSINAISVYQSPNVEITRNKVVADRLSDPARGPAIWRPRFSSQPFPPMMATEGITIQGTTSGYVVNNQITSFGDGVGIESTFNLQGARESKDITIQNNAVEIVNSSSSRYGIEIRSGSINQKVQGNTVVGDFDIGIVLGAITTGNQVVHNTIRGVITSVNDPDEGIQIGVGAHDNTISHNVISGIATLELAINDTSGSPNTIKGNRITI